MYAIEPGYSVMPRVRIGMYLGTYFCCVPTIIYIYVQFYGSKKCGRLIVLQIMHRKMFILYKNTYFRDNR